jgi:hypothetical protein
LRALTGAGDDQRRQERDTFPALRHQLQQRTDHVPQGHYTLPQNRASLFLLELK